jgi:GT2 family glycosyltransferase
VRLPERRSYAAAVNAGLAAARDCDAVLLLNADCVLADGALAALASHLEREPRVGAVAPKLLRDVDPGRIDAAGMALDRRRRNNVVGHGEPSSAYATPGPVFAPDGACGLWRRATLDDVAPDGEVLDEGLALWATDADLTWRARARGWRAMYEPAAAGRHVRFFGPATRTRVASEHRRLQLRNRLLMVVRNDRPRDVLRDLHHILLFELAALAYGLVAERALLGAYADAARGLRRALWRRARAPEGRCTPPFGLMPPR